MRRCNLIMRITASLPLFLFSVFLFLKPSLIFAAEYIRIETYGKAEVIDGNLAAARDTALNDAFKKAVEEAVKNEPFLVDIEKRGGVLTEKILSKASLYIARFHVALEEQIEEIKEGDLAPSPFYRLYLAADISGSILYTDLVKSGIITEGVGNRQNITISILDIYEYREFVKLKDTLKDIKDIKGIFYNTFSRGKIILKIESVSPASAIAGLLSKKGFGDFTIETLTVSDTFLIIKRR